ncbi:hypothetical protein SCP_0201000 [Sparassis crispa]|uniref:Uncharacterized protein n=1 Tax=Sparassis crispa TaxID=139825 RepID=A0A401G9U5_9APHY|nr:hypothetical protein SCP_0201000 [Sparassis crispa]GBE78903.1 hypothetical protein SCP_0201000 [Sparassis crispa]
MSCTKPGNNIVKRAALCFAGQFHFTVQLRTGGPPGCQSSSSGSFGELCRGRVSTHLLQIRWDFNIR